MNLVAPIMLSVLAVATPVTSPAPKHAAPLSKYQQQQQEKFKHSAPADEYFGKMKMSYLGINNTFHDASISAGNHTTDHTIITKVALADDALSDWSKHYPNDPQLPRSYFLAINIEKKIWMKPNQERAWIYMNRIVKVFPDSYFGKAVKKDLAIGYTEHYYAEPAPCATPVPVAVATPAAAETPQPRRRGAQPTPTPTPEPTATPSPQPTATPGPKQIAKGLKLQIETPACVAPPAAAPMASSAPQPAASPR